MGGLLFFWKGGASSGYEYEEASCKIIGNAKQVGFYCHYSVAAPGHPGKVYQVRINANECATDVAPCYLKFDEHHNFVGVRSDSRSLFQWKIVGGVFLVLGALSTMTGAKCA